MTAEQIGNDGLTDSERKAYADKYARTLGSPVLTRAERDDIQTYRTKREAAMTEAEFLGLDDVIAKATERTKASETAADELVRLYEALRTWLPSIVTGDTARAAEAWKEQRR